MTRTFYMREYTTHLQLQVAGHQIHRTIRLDRYTSPYPCPKAAGLRQQRVSWVMGFIQCMGDKTTLLNQPLYDQLTGLPRRGVPYFPIEHVILGCGALPLEN